jgi:hypothetical protein
VNNPNKTTIYKGGLPTEMDVKKLFEAFPRLREGDRILFTEIEDVLDLKKDTHRFKTVVQIWRERNFRDFNLYVKNIRTVGYEIAIPYQRIDASSDKIVRGTRSIIRGGRIASTTNTSDLTPDYKRIADHNVKIASSAKLAYDTRQRALQPPC